MRVRAIASASVALATAAPLLYVTTGTEPRNLCFFSSIVPSADESADVVGDTKKNSCGCSDRDIIPNVVAKVTPAVVNLSIQKRIFGIRIGKHIMSGTIIAPNGTILTCAPPDFRNFLGLRTSSEGKVDVTLQDGRTFEGTMVENVNLHSDIAFVKIRSTTPLPTAKLGFSSKLRPGDWVVAMGCPLSLRNIVTAGLLSCVDRKSSELSLEGMEMKNLKTDGATNLKHPGGPLVNADGEVVGVNIPNLVAGGLNVFVPVDLITKIVESFRMNERVISPWLGMEMVDLNEIIIAQVKKRDPTFPNVTRGVLADAVTPGSLADRAGFQPGDVVIKIDGKPVGSMKEILEIMEERGCIPFKVTLKRSNDILANLAVVPDEGNPGNLPLVSSRVGPVPLAGTSNESLGVAGDSPKRSCGCLGRDTIADAVATVGPAVVGLCAVLSSSVDTAYGNWVSGAIIDSNGTILTAAPDGLMLGGKVIAILEDGRKFAGSVVYTDSNFHFAIVKINSKTPLPTAKLCSSDKLRPGDWVVAVGRSPSLQNSLAGGIVSCFRKSSELGLEGMQGEFLQTDCELIPGNVGGPLINVDGDVVGVNNMTTFGKDRMNFALSIDSIAEIMKHLKRSGKEFSPCLGLEMSNLDETSIAQIKEKDATFPYITGGVSVPAPSLDVTSECSDIVVDSPKQSCGCFHRDTISNVVARVGPAVVTVSVPMRLFGIPVGTATASGTIIDSDGTILTCAHVIDTQRRRVSKEMAQITLQDGRTFEGTVVNADLHSDIAILKINSTIPLPTAKLGSSSKLRPGDRVVAMDFPLPGKNTVTAGVISCVDRKLWEFHPSWVSWLSRCGKLVGLESDCASNMGSSGGPLVNVDGEVVGINIGQPLFGGSLAFSVPVDLVAKLMEHYRLKGRVISPCLGLEMIDLDETIIAQLKERDATFPNVSRGALVTVVPPGSPAAAAGFRPGDVFIKFDGKPVRNMKEIIEIIGDRVGKPTEVVLKRQNDVQMNLTIIPEEANPDM